MPDPHNGTRQLLDSASGFAAEYLESIDDRPVAPRQGEIDALSQFDVPLSDRPVDPQQVIELMHRVGSPATVASAGGRYFGFVIGGALPVTVAAQWLASAWDQCPGVHVLSPAAVRMEEIALGWLRDLLDLPSECGAGFVTGATTANFCALASARHALLAQQGWNVEEQGLFGAPPIDVIVQEEVHVSMQKALSLVGFGNKRVITVPSDDKGCMRADLLPALKGPTIVCTQAGNVNSGATDPIGQICDAVRPHGAWVHVDGAFGLWAAASPTYRHLTAGCEKADSWALDAHKWLNVPYDSGLVFVRDDTCLQRAMTTDASYLILREGREPHHRTPEMSRRARGVEVWAALAALGREGIASLIDRCCEHARRFAEGLAETGYEILNDVELNQVLVSFGSDERTQAVIEAVQQDGTCWCGGTVWKGRHAMRISVSSWATTQEDVEKSLAAMIRVARSS